MRYLGIDIGTTFIKVCILNSNQDIQKKWYIRHYFEPIRALLSIIDEIRYYKPDRFNITGSAGDILKSVSKDIKPLDVTASNIAFASHFYKDIRHIIDIGAGSLSYIRLNKRGELEGITTNSLCAAGTGSFVDEQLSRLGLNYEVVSSFKRIENPPSIATRCAVFAKSDITHRQQEGYSKEESYSGLCKGLATTIFQSLMRGKVVNEEVLILGGLTLNSKVMYWLNKALNGHIIISDNSEVSAAIGSALLTIRDGGYPFDRINTLFDTNNIIKKTQKLRPPLKLNLSRFPEDSSEIFYVDNNGTEVRIYHDISNKKINAYLGMDIGSTSTKCVLIDNENRIVADFYRKTSGEPIIAAKRLFSAILELEKQYQAEIYIKGFATTGSGRRLIGELFGADLIINEITAHAEGAISLFPDTTTIFEIGGQDSKYIRIENKKVVDSNMNYVCAAGTGSFIEEQAKRLGFNINEVGGRVEGISPPFTSDRCTVFMEQDINRLLKEGYSREEVLAAVHYSIIQNYLTKVVGNRPIDRDNIVFMGATARNKGLVAAIENILNVKVNVSPYCYINGAYGAAVLLRNRFEKRALSSRFRGFELLNSEISISKKECKLCSNRCHIFSAISPDGKSLSSWGYMCGREEEETVSRHSPYYEPYEIRERLIKSSLLPVDKNYKFTIGIPRALFTYTYLPFFYNLFVLIGFRPVLSRRTDEDILLRGSSVLTSDFCYPIKVAHGHIRYLLDVAKTDFILTPDMISEENNNITTNSLFCPYLSSFGSMVKSIFEMRGEDEKRLISFPLDFRMSQEKILNLIYDELHKKGIKISIEDLKDAYEKAIQIQRNTEKALEEKGREIISSLKKEERAIIVVGRPYNSIDGDVNLSIPGKIAQLGFKVIPIDMVPFDINLLKGRYENIYWEYGQRIISALLNVAKSKNLNAVYISNFKCGPDSFLLSIAEDIMKSKPMLILEIDEHGADAGYQTRIEAFSEVLRSESENSISVEIKKDISNPLSQRIVLIPPMHEITSRLFAASFKCEGYKALSLPRTTYESFNLGKMFTRGSECLPMIVTLGSLLDFINKSKYSPSELAYFMPSATGPCRFGQYAILSEIALKKAGIEDIMIISPAAYNTYRGLSVSLRMRLWYSVLIGDLLYKMAMRIRPYELIEGMTDKLQSHYIRVFERGIERDLDLFEIMHSAVKDFLKIPVDKSRRLPLVGVMGEIYVRSEPFSNQDLIKFVEEAGAEAWLTPLSEWFHYVSEMRLFFQQEGLREKDPLSVTKALLFKQFFRMTENEFVSIAKPVLYDREEPDVSETIELGSKYVNRLFEGETIITIGRALEFIRSGVDLILNVSPFNCMPGTISSGVFERIQKEYNVCILNLFYDGEGDINHIIKTAISNISKKSYIREQISTDAEMKKYQENLQNLK